MSSIFRQAQKNLYGEPAPQQQQEVNPEAAMPQQQKQVPAVFQRAQERPPMQRPGPVPQQFISKAKEASRVMGGLAARGIEGAAGSYGDIGSLIRENIFEPAMKSGIEGVKKVSAPVGNFLEKTTQNPVVKAVARGSSGILGAPTTEELRGVTKSLTGEYLEPKTEKEKFGQEFIGDVGAFLAPGPGGKARVAGKVASKLPLWAEKSKPLLRGLAVVSAGHAAEQGAKAVGVSEENAKNIKNGVMIVTSMFDHKGAKKISDKKYSEANRHLPQHALAPATKVENAIDDIDKILTKGEELPWKSYVRSTIDSIKKKLAYGEMPVEDLQQRLQDIGDKISDWDVSRGVRKKADPFLKKIRHAVSESLDEYGEMNPQWHKEWKEAQEIRSALHKGEWATRFIQKVAKEHGLKGFATALGGGVYHAGQVGIAPAAAKLAAGGAVLGAAGAGVLKSAEVLQRIWHSPVLRKYYLQLFQDATKENAKSVARDLKKIDRELQNPSSEEE